MSAVAVTSMTGFARSEGHFEGRLPFAWVWEAKSVNGKNLEVRLRLPQGFESLEIPARQAAAELFTRGSLTLSLSLAAETATREIAVDETLLDALIALASRKSSQLGPDVMGKAIAPARLDGLMALAQARGSSEQLDAETLAARDAKLVGGLKTALTGLAQARRQEGARLAAVVGGHIDTVATLSTKARSLAATQPEALKARLFRQIEELVGSTPALPADRMAQEAVLLALKYDVREELDRLTSHVTQARELLGKGEPCGRRLEFLSQEFNREANTLCSKSADVTLTQIGLALKSAIDQFREQIQNIE